MKIIKTNLKLIILIAIIVVVCLAIFFIKNSSNKEEIDTTYLVAKLEKASELTTAKLTYKGFSKFKDKGIVILNKSDFLMVYSATARAGIDVKEIEIDVDKITKTVKVKIPEAKILEVKVDPTSIKYYDEKFALFNFNSKEDANKAQALAETEAKEEIAKMGILETSNEQAEALIKGLLQDTIPENYKLVVTK